MKILIADDERDIADAIGMILKYHGYECDVVYDGKQALDQANSQVYDAMVLDIMMPRIDGITLLKALREAEDYTPILLLTAKAEVEDRIYGIDMGADDYLAKPFDRRELLARINSMTRRKHQYEKAQITKGNTTLDVERLELNREGSALRLAKREAEMLAFLMHHTQRWISESMFTERFWKEEEEAEGEIALYIGYLRNKLKSIQSNLEIQMEEGKGYQLHIRAIK